MKQTFIINKDLKMSKGKIAVQVAHGEVFYMEEKFTGHSYGTMYDNYIDWMKDYTMKKIVLKASEQEMIELEAELKEKGIWTHKVYDLGLTQILANSFTCLVIEPLENTFNQFKLL